MKLPSQSTKSPIGATYTIGGAGDLLSKSQGRGHPATYQPSTGSIKSAASMTISFPREFSMACNMLEAGG